MESAMLLIAAISGILQGVQMWLETRDRRAAKQAQEAAFVSTLRSASIEARAERLMAIVPPGTIDRLRQKVQECYEKFNDMLDNEEDYFPVDIDSAAHSALPSCVCRNLRRIVAVNGSLPDEEFQVAWARYKCKP